MMKREAACRLWHMHGWHRSGGGGARTCGKREIGQKGRYTSTGGSNQGEKAITTQKDLLRRYFRARNGVDTRGGGEKSQSTQARKQAWSEAASRATEGFCREGKRCGG